jgi:hypothetical protein
MKGNRMHILQLNPPIPIFCPKGKGIAYFLIDYDIDYDLMWTIAIDETGEFWTYKNPEVRAINNITLGRVLNEF